MSFRAIAAEKAPINAVYVRQMAVMESDRVAYKPLQSSHTSLLKEEYLTSRTRPCHSQSTSRTLPRTRCHDQGERTAGLDLYNGLGKCAPKGENRRFIEYQII